LISFKELGFVGNRFQPMHLLDFQTIKQSLPKYKVIDVSAINKYNGLLDVLSTIETKSNIVLVSFPSNNNTMLWSKLERLDQVMIDSETNVLYPATPNIRMWNKNNFIKLCQEKTDKSEDIVKMIKLWLQCESKDNCYICDEEIKIAGPMCSTCCQAPCSKCFKSMTKIGNFNCSLCRSQVVKVARLIK